MITLLRSTALLFALALLVAGCHASGGAVGVLPSSSTNGNSSEALGTASFSIVVPSRRAASPAIQSVAVSLVRLNDAATTAVLPVKMNLTAATRGCVAQADGSRKCVASIAAPAGRDTFTVVTYSGPDGTGVPVSSTSATAAISPGGKTYCVPSASATHSAAATKAAS